MREEDVQFPQVSQAIGAIISHHVMLSVCNGLNSLDDVTYNYYLLGIVQNSHENENKCLLLEKTTTLLATLMS